METKSKKMWRPKGTTNKWFTIHNTLRDMKPWQYLYLRWKDDKDITSRIYRLWMTWQFTTKRVILADKRWGAMESGVLITKI